jgi:hypothetical protein
MVGISAYYSSSMLDSAPNDILRRCVCIVRRHLEQHAMSASSNSSRVIEGKTWDAKEKNSQSAIHRRLSYPALLR